MGRAAELELGAGRWHRGRYRRDLKLQHHHRQHILRASEQLIGRVGLPAGGKLDFVMISYVLEMYMSEPQHCDMMSSWLDVESELPCRAVIISSRSQTLDAAALMRQRGCVVHPLMEQTERDERQTLFLAKSTAEAMAAAKARGAQDAAAARALKAEGLFPNVPFEEHKTHQAR